TYTNAQGCTASDTRSVTVVSPSVINAGSDHELCQNAPSFTLSPVDAGGTWSGSGSVTAAGVFTPTTAGIHNLIYTLSTGVCTSTDNVVVIVNALPSVSAGADEAMCLGQSVQLDGSISGGESPYTILWNNGGTLSSNTQLTPTATPAATTNYLLTVFDNNFCMNTDAVTVTVNSLPVVNAGSDITVCDQPIATTLTGQSPAGGTWTGSGVTAGGDFTPTGTGAFVLTYTYTNANGCQASDTRTVNVTTSPGISAGADQEYCLNNGTELLSAFTSDAGTWSGPGIVDGTTGLFDPTMAGAGTHHITLTNGSGTCAVSDEVVVVVHSLPVVTAGADEIFCEEAAPAALSGAWPPGGHWEGTGIINSVAGIFDPDEAPGDYPVQYIYTEALTTCADTAAKIVQVAALPEAEFDVPAIQCAGLPVSLDNQSTGGSAWTWSFEGAADMGGFEPAYAFSSDGTYD
ncbi:MAG: hypothetical protein JNM00_03580, partial [Flavobacteriales bacterium]|nr:hypothetical protein [Flavobacteriales bacterium]